MNTKEEQIADSLNCFLKQFGFIDIYTQIVIEEVFKELLNESNLCLSGEERQEGN